MWVKVAFCGFLSLFYNSEVGVCVFRGVQYINMDAKGRMAVPAKHRGALVSDDCPQLIVTVDPTTPLCLRVYPMPTWEAFEEKLQAAPLNAAARQVKRIIIGSATELELDANGRICLPAALRESAGLEKKLALVGQGDKFELWSEDAWQEERRQAMESANSGKQVLPEEFANLVL